MIDDSGASNNRRTRSLEWLNLMYMLFIGVSALIALTCSFLPRMDSPSAQETLTESWFHYSDLQVHYLWSRPTPEESEVPLVCCSICVVFSIDVCAVGPEEYGCVIGFGSLSFILHFCLLRYELKLKLTYWHRRLTTQSNCSFVYFQWHYPPLKVFLSNSVTLIAFEVSINR